MSDLVGVSLGLAVQIIAVVMRGSADAEDSSMQIVEDVIKLSSLRDMSRSRGQGAEISRNGKSRGSRRREATDLWEDPSDRRATERWDMLYRRRLQSVAAYFATCVFHPAARARF